MINSCDILWRINIGHVGTEIEEIGITVIRVPVEFLQGTRCTWPTGMSSFSYSGYNAKSVSKLIETVSGHSARSYIDKKATMAYTVLLRNNRRMVIAIFYSSFILFLCPANRSVNDFGAAGCRVSTAQFRVVVAYPRLPRADADGVCGHFVSLPARSCSAGPDPAGTRAEDSGDCRREGGVVRMTR